MNALSLYAMGFAGLFVHWAKRRLRGQSGIGFLAYLAGAPGYTACSILVLIGSITGLVAQGAAADPSAQTLAMAFMAGYTLDSMLNKEPADEQ